MRRHAFLIIFLIVFSFAGCGANRTDRIPAGQDKEPGMTGYVMGQDKGRILVVDPVSQDFSSTGGVKEFYDAIWFSNVPDDIREGDKVKVWFDAVEQSYPGQAAALKIEVIADQRPDSANLDESEAVYRALKSEEISTRWPTVLKSIRYNKESDAWEVELRETIGEQLKTFNIQIKDE